MKKQIIILLATFVSLSAFAQSTHELSVYAGGGLSTLNYDLSKGDRENGWGGDFGLGYTFFFNENWGINTGVGLALYNAKALLNNTTLITPNLRDDEGDPFDMHSTFGNYEEKQNTMFLNIPLMVQYQTGKTHKLYAMGGVKVGIPMSGTYEMNSATITNKGYYTKINNWAETQKFAGFGVFKNQESDGDIDDMKLAFMLSAEAGMKWAVSKVFSLYTGLYFDYGLNDISGTHNKPHIDYNANSPTVFALNSITNSQYAQTQNGATQTFTDKIAPMAVGVKLRLSFGVQKKPVQEIPKKLPEPKKESKPQPKPEPQPQPQPEVQPQQEVQPKPQPEPQLIEEKPQRPVEPQERSLIATNGYKVSGTTLSDSQKKEMDVLIATLKQNPNAKFYIYGHTCELGGDRVNEQIGLKRAENAKTYMLSKGIAKERILGVASKRSNEPLAPNTNEANRKMNRRVEVVILE